MKWYKAFSRELPKELDKTSSKVYNYVRQKIEEKTITDDTSGEEIQIYEYDEAKISKKDWDLYESVSDNAANIDYIAMMTGIDL